MQETVVLPIFPLHDVVLLPGAVLPFKLFEPRYVQLIEEVMSQEEPLMVMSKLKPCSEFDYFLHPDFEEWGCIGEVVMHKKKEDGTHDILLMGIERANLEEADTSDERLYRCVHARPVPLPELPDMHQSWLRGNEEIISHCFSKDRDDHLIVDLYRKWDDNFINARNLLHVFIHTMERNADILQEVLMDEEGDLGMEILQTWMDGKTTEEH